MENVVNVLEIIVPIFVVIALGMIAKRKKLMTPEQITGLQQFVTRFALPCVLFNSCYTSNLGIEDLTMMIILLPLILFSTLWAFGRGKKKYPYHNLPMMFSAQESGMLGIPLFITLFGAAEAYRMGVLDISQALVAVPVIAILTSDAGEQPETKEIVKRVFQSPLLLMSLLGLILNLTGTAAWLNQMGIGSVLTETTGFIAQPVSAVILFTVGYNFSLGKQNRSQIFKLCGFHFGLWTVFCLIMQAAMFLIPSVEMETRWAVLIYCMLPTSFLSPGMGKNETEYTIASSVASVLTVVTMVVFCIVAVAAA